MKKKTWLFIIVLVVLVINISFFVLVRMAKVDKIVQTRITDQLSKTLNADITMEQFTFNDTQMNISGIRIVNSGNYDLKINQLYIEYDLIKLIYSKFKNFKAIKHIKIYEPEFSLIIKTDEKKKENNEFAIPDIAEYFRMLNIYSGKFNIKYKNSIVEVENSWQNIDLSIKNTASSDILLTATSQAESSLFASGKLNKGVIEKVDFKLKDLKLSKFEISQLTSLDFLLDADLIYEDDILRYSAAIKNINTQYADKKASIDSISISGNNKKSYITLHNAILDDNKIYGNAVINKLLSNNPTIKSELTTSDVSFEKYIDQITGNMRAKININGKLAKPVITAELSSNKLTAANQEFTDISVSAKMIDDNIEFSLDNSLWEDNQLIGDGYYKLGKDLHLELNSNNINWQKGNIRISGDFTSTINYLDKPEIDVDLNDIDIIADEMGINNLDLKAKLLGDDLTIDLTHPEHDIGLSSIGNISSKEMIAKIKLRGLDLNTVFNKKSYPIITGDVEINANPYSIVTNSNIMVYDMNYGKLGGRLKTDIVLDLSNERSLINMRSYNAKYNYEPFNIDLLAEGSLDSLYIKHCQLNKMLQINGWIKREPNFKYGISLLGKDIKIRQLSKYFVDYNTSNQMDGSLSIDATVNNLEDGLIIGNITCEDFRIGDMNKLDAKLNFAGNKTMVSLHDGYINTNEHKIIDLQGALILEPEMLITANGRIDSLLIDEILPEGNLKGIVKGGLEFSREQNNNELHLDLEIDKLKFNSFKADLIKCDVLQKDSLLYVNDIRCYKKNEFSLRSNGVIGYNIINSKVFSDTNNISIKFNGDLLKLLADQTKVITVAGSEADFKFKVGTKDNKIFVKQGNLALTQGTMKIKGQPEHIDKITIQFGIENNIFIIDKFKFRMGEGRCYISNVINNNSEDFVLGTLNLGKLLVKTDHGGILFNMPGYIPKNNVAKVVINGRDSEYFEVRGPFEDIMMIGDLNVSNGGAIYPPNTENLLKLFNTVREKKEVEVSSLPLSFDLMINIGENVKYVTYPVDVKVNSGGYLNIVYKNEEFSIPDALFIAEEGSVDIFGTEMTLDYMQVQLSRFIEGANISGTFYKKTADGSLITLNVYNEITGTDDMGTLKFSLNSDNPNDRITDILAKLRYNRSMENISPDQKKTLLQDEVLQIAGIGLESAVMDPLLSPVENWLRMFLKLDYFHLQTDLVQNLFASYSSEDKLEYEVYDETNEIAKFSSELFLNNLSVSMGRYVTRDLFLDYETRFERSNDVAINSEMGIFHELSLRYQLPYKFRIIYKYKIMPFEEEHSQEIMLERSFRF
ncbi:MAG: hypothetical protein P9L97_10110 [Candidatus Tenebribacter davisii]|nr:hypothetical protein [Candidatus Tenebribacter davisii]